MGDGDVTVIARITLRDVAHRAGVSTSTASRALAGVAGVTEETRERVVRIAEELDYRPNELARGLVRASSSIIGGLILEFANPFFVSLIAAIETVADEHDHVAVIGETRRQLAVETRLVERLRRLRVAGCVVTPVMESIDHLLAMREEGIPVVAVGRRCSALDYVCADDSVGSTLVAQHLLELGHRHVAYVCSGELFNEPEQVRWLGLRRVFREAGLACRDSDIVEVGSLTEEAAFAAADRILALPVRPTAVFAATDRLAIGLIHRLRQREVAVPGDIAVVGYDDIPTAEFVEVPLTTVSYPKQEMGRLAAQMLFERIQGIGVRRIEHVLLQPQLVVRQSSGARQ